MPSSASTRTSRRRPRAGIGSRRRVDSAASIKYKALALFAIFPALTSAQSSNCVSLKDSKACKAFQSAAVSKNDALAQSYPFLRFVSDIKSFDSQLTDYLKTSYVRDKYENVLGCRDLNLTDTDNLYARYTTTVLCNVLVQRSVGDCALSQQDARPVCADTCAEFAQSEAVVSADDQLCANPRSDINKLIRADFTTCALPDGALSGRCVSGSDNEPDNCGFGNSRVGLCSYCAAGGINSTDTCCYGADAEKRCQGVRLPSVTPTLSFSMPTATSSPTASPASDGGGHRALSGGVIAGIVFGTLGGLFLLGLLLFCCFRQIRQLDGSQKGSIFNQPSPARKGPSMSQSKLTPPEGYEVLPGGRVARMSALEGHSGGSPPHQFSGQAKSGNGDGALPVIAGAAAAAHAAGGRSKRPDSPSSSDEYGESPSGLRSMHRPPAATRRKGSLSSGSMLESHQSPSSGAENSSPMGMGSQNSEQLPFFKDYYSQDDIHPGDKVAVLWAYQPRAIDELALERGDMLKVAGIWDDGWATGVLIDERAEEWDARRQAQRDSGVSNATEPRDNSPLASEREMKAFPLVCVCLPEHWRKTIETEVSTEAAAGSSSKTPAGAR